MRIFFSVFLATAFGQGHDRIVSALGKLLAEYSHSGFRDTELTRTSGPLTLTSVLLASDFQSPHWFLTTIKLGAGGGWLMTFQMLARGQMAYLDPCVPLYTLLTHSARRSGKGSLGLS